MKRLLPVILCVSFIISFTCAALANSGPVYWQGYPSTGIMAVDRNSPITVEREDLLFDFSGYDGSFYTVSGSVKATYRMYNPTGEAQSVQMAFPFVGSINRHSPELLSAGDVTITADEDIIPYDVYIGSVVGSHGQQGEGFEFSKIVNSITDGTYRAESFEEDERGRLYTIYVDSNAGRETTISVRFDLDETKTRVLTGGFSQLERNGRETILGSRCYKPEVLVIFVLGEDLDLDINAYADGKPVHSYRVTVQDTGLKSYLMEYAKEKTIAKAGGFISDIQLYNLYAQALDNHFIEHMGICSEDDLRAMGEQKRIITLVYTVDFPPESEKEVSVSYSTSGTMEGRKTSKPLYSFEYMLNPAQNWADFKDLSIEIIPPRAVPYVVESSIALARGQDGVYRAFLDRLPEQDLAFTLYAFEKITLLDRVYGSIQRRFRYLTPIVLGALLPLIVGVTVIAAVIKRKRERSL